VRTRGHENVGIGGHENTGMGGCKNAGMGGHRDMRTRRTREHGDMRM